MAAASPANPPCYVERSEALDLGSSADVSLLPAYPSSSSDTTRPSSGGTSSSSKEFTFTIERRGRPLALLTIFANGELSNPVPTFVEGRPIKGNVHLALDKVERFQAISVRLQGKLISGGPSEGDELVFLDVPHTIWSPSSGDPRNSTSNFTPHSPNTGPLNTPQGSSNGKFLAGDYVWEFAIDLPREVTIASGRDRVRRSFRLPQTFAERHIRASIAYSITMKISTNSFLHQSLRTGGQIGYIPFTRPPPFPPLRMDAYQENRPVLPPLLDPEGWTASNHITSKGTLFKSRVVEVDCTLYLADPLVYTRSAVIPVYLEISSDDSHVVSLLSSPKAVVCRLRRYVKVDDDALNHTVTWKDHKTDSQPASWWKPTQQSGDIKDSGRFASLMGELHLSGHLKPSSALDWFEVNYFVVLLPFEATGFDPEESSPLTEIPVEIVTAFAPGPRPRSSLPPEYETETVMRPAVPAPERLASMLDRHAFQ